MVFSKSFIEMCLEIHSFGLDFLSSWDLSLTTVFWIGFSIKRFKRFKRVLLSGRILAGSHNMVYVSCC